MRAYIYFIVNKTTGKRYVGQTTNFIRRRNTHLTKLNNNTHFNIKLQQAWNKYGSSDFVIEKIQYDNITKEDLDEQEIFYIKKFNSVEAGYNIKNGGSNGSGNNTRGKLSFEDYAFAFLGNTKYKGMTSRTAKILNIDSSTISAIANLKSYIWYQEQLNQLSEEEKNKIIKSFEELTNIKGRPPFTLQKTLSDENTLKILCFVSTYGRGAEAFCLRYFNLTKGFVFHFVTGSGRKSLKDYYKQMSQEEIQKIGEKSWEEWGKPKLQKKYQNLKDKYPNQNF